MRVYWYWPFLRQEDTIIVATTANDGVDIHVDTLDRPGAPAAERHTEYSISPILPEVNNTRRWSPRWLLDRTTTYTGRARTRRRRIEQLEPDIVHIWFLNRFLDAFSIPRLARRHRLIVHVHDVFPHGRRLPSAIERWLLQRIYGADVDFVVHHRHLATRLVESFDVPDKRIHEIPLMVRPMTESSRTVANDDRTILMFGTLRRNKGLIPLLAALSGSDVDLRLVIAGRGEPELESAVRAAAASDPRIVANIGWITESEKTDLFTGASIVLLPYTSFESQSGVLHDAYSHRVPVVVTDVGALGVTVREDDTGVVVDALDAGRVLDAAAALLDNPLERARLSKNCTRVGADRSPESIARQLQALYAEIS